MGALRGQSTGARVAWWLAAILLVMAATAPAVAESQRMILALGCYILAPGKYFDADAYCLDRSLAAPASGSLLGNAPAGLGQAEVRVDDSAPLSLQEGIARHIVQIEGLGDHLRVRIKNRTADKVEICIFSPAVVMANGAGYIGDLSKIYDQIARVLTQHDANEDSPSHDSESAQTESTHTKLQQTLWDAIAVAVQRESSRQAASKTLTPSVDSPPATPNASQCAGQAGARVWICVAK